MLPAFYGLTLWWISLLPVNKTTKTLTVSIISSYLGLWLVSTCIYSYLLLHSAVKGLLYLHLQVQQSFFVLLYFVQLLSTICHLKSFSQFLCITLLKITVSTNQISPLHSSLLNKLFNFILIAFFLPCPNHIFYFFYFFLNNLLSGNIFYNNFRPKNFLGANFLFRIFYYLISILFQWVRLFFFSLNFHFHFHFHIFAKLTRTVWDLTITDLNHVRHFFFFVWLSQFIFCHSKTPPKGHLLLN